MSDYGNDSIRALSDKEAMRLRPANNLGSDDINGVFQALKEIVDNSIDEVKSGYGNEVVISKCKDGFYSVKDSGRGVPMAWSNRESKYNYELVFMTLNAGGKYSTEEDGTFSFPKGLNGIGSSACSFTSEYFYAESIRDGNKYKLEMKEGEFVSFHEEEVSEDEKTGTFIKWKPDIKVFKEIDIPFEWIKEFAKEQAVVNKKTKIIAIDETTDSKFEFVYENGIVDYLNEVSSDSGLTTPQYYEVDSKGRDREDLKDYRARFQVAFVFNNDVNMLSSYHNSSYLKHGGSPWIALKSAFAYAIHRYITDNKLYNKKEKRVTWEDIEDSLIIITNTYSMQTSYANQTKLAITNEFVKDFMNEWLREQLEIYFTENPKDAKVIAEQVLINKRSSEKAEDSRKLIRSQLQAKETVAGLQVEGLVECDIKNSEMEEREVWICEGLSAAQTMTNARDDRTMGTIALRGRFISSLKKSVEKVLGNAEARAVIKALGCGIEIPPDEKKKYKGMEPFDAERLRYGKVVIAVDEDDAGKAISLALMTFFYKFMPEIIKQDRLYISRSPRYRFTDRKNGEEKFAYNEEEKVKLIEELDGLGKKYDINIVKGLGELNQNTYWDYVMNPETRYIERVIYDESKKEEVEKYFEVFMGEDTADRKKFINENIVNVNLEEILD